MFEYKIIPRYEFFPLLFKYKFNQPRKASDQQIDSIDVQQMGKDKHVLIGNNEEIEFWIMGKLMKDCTIVENILLEM